MSLSSRAHLNSPVVFDDVDFEHRTYDPALAYAQSKTANVLFAVSATTSAFVATWPALAEVGGRCFESCQQSTQRQPTGCGHCREPGSKAGQRTPAVTSAASLRP